MLRDILDQEVKKSEGAEQRVREAFGGKKEGVLALGRRSASSGTLPLP